MTLQKRAHKLKRRGLEMIYVTGKPSTKAHSKNLFSFTNYVRQFTISSSCTLNYNVSVIQRRVRLYVG